ncbi:hypothetical protein [Vulcanisaeta distributa]|uniref:Uncharacterized protein n=1 Tax=Vulcanisaeta distributa (strain DSM 14429 / JCM 11212 / NBRC 100878 / IC-017) TaxID=572478 RepID=E1QRL7_VULDI|nr:hypothetical protein [Vulcanisaeta distributa]ADN51831.1 hypothetical protein Vdis_2466 [Vulcanisaeta distributa DSM 14429]
MSEKKPEEKQARRPPYQQYPAYPPPPPPPPQMPPPPPPQYRPPPPPPYSQPYQPPPQPPPRQVPVTRPVTQQPRIEELTPNLSKLVLYLGIPLALIAIIFVITAITLFPTTSDAYVPYSSIAFMASLITVAAALIVSFIAMYQIAMGLDRRFEYLTRIIRQQSSTAQVTTTPSTPQYLPQPQQSPERILAPPPRPPQVKPQQPQQPAPQEEGVGEEQQPQEGSEESLNEE